MTTQELNDTARTLVAGGKGLLAMDESNATCDKRFAVWGIPQTEAARHAYRELIITTPRLSDCISGVILYDETIREHKSDGTSFVKLIVDGGIIPGIKVDTGAEDLAGHAGEKITEGLDATALAVDVLVCSRDSAAGNWNLARQQRKCCCRAARPLSSCLLRSCRAERNLRCRNGSRIELATDASNTTAHQRPVRQSKPPGRARFGTSRRCCLHGRLVKRKRRSPPRAHHRIVQNVDGNRTRGALGSSRRILPCHVHTKIANDTPSSTTGPAARRRPSSSAAG